MKSVASASDILQTRSSRGLRCCCWPRRRAHWRRRRPRRRATWRARRPPGGIPLPGVTISASNSLTGKKAATSTGVDGAYVPGGAVEWALRHPRRAGGLRGGDQGSRRERGQLPSARRPGNDVAVARATGRAAAAAADAAAGAGPGMAGRGFQNLALATDPTGHGAGRGQRERWRCDRHDRHAVAGAEPGRGHRVGGDCVVQQRRADQRHDVRRQRRADARTHPGDARPRRPRRNVGSGRHGRTGRRPGRLRRAGRAGGPRRRTDHQDRRAPRLQPQQAARSAVLFRQRRCLRRQAVFAERPAHHAAELLAAALRRHPRRAAENSAHLQRRHQDILLPQLFRQSVEQSVRRVLHRAHAGGARGRFFRRDHAQRRAGAALRSGHAPAARQQPDHRHQSGGAGAVEIHPAAQRAGQLSRIFTTSPRRRTTTTT